LRWNADRTVRLREDGAPLQIVFEVLDADAPLAELVVQNLNRVGIQATARVLERNLFDVRKNSYEFQMSTERWPGNPFTAPYIVAPFGRFSPVWGQYGAWVDSQGQEGVEPTGDAAKIAPAWKAVEGARTEAERMARLQEFYNLQRDNLWIVGLYSINRPGYFVVNDALRNVPDGAIAANFMRTPNNLWPWQFYFE